MVFKWLTSVITHLQSHIKRQKWKVA